MKQRYSLRSNAVKFRAIALILIAFFMGGKMTVGATWKPAGTTSATYVLRSTGTTGNNFDVYIQNGTTLVYDGGGYTEINGRINLSPDVNITLIFENERTILFNGQFDFNGDNSSLTMRLGDISATTIAHSHDNPTLRIIGTSGYNNQNVAFFLRSSSSTNVNQRKLIIEGASPTGTENIGNFQYNWDNNFVIDGDGPTLTVVDSTSMTPKVKAEARNNISTCSVKPYALFRIQQGTLHLTNVTVQYFSNSWTNSGMVQLFPGNANAGVDLKFEHCYFTHIGAKSSTGSPVLRMQGQGGTNANRNALVKNCEFKEIFGSYYLAIGQTTAIDNANGTIRTLGNNKTPLTIEGCHLKHNYGCPVRWHGCGSSEKMMVKNCLIEYNFTCLDTNANGGGGLLLKGPAEIQNCTIQNNHTNGSGGGIYLSTYTDFNTGTYGLIPEHTILQLDPTTHIANNIALGNGGGVAIEPVLMKNPYYNSNEPNFDYLSSTGGYIYHNESNEPFTVEFIQNGATISDNTSSGDGGGVFINRPITTTFYKTVCYLDKGEISRNHANINGGGVAIVTTSNFENPESMPSSVHPQDVTVTISDEAATEEMLIEGNSAVNGGGIYLEAYPITYNSATSIVTTTVLDYSNVNNNTATTSGGGLYVQCGTVSILKNNDEGTHKPTMTKNTATNGDGGGLYLVDGVVRIKGAVIGGTNPTDGNAAKNGGGVYVEKGDVNINYWKRDDYVATSYVQQYESSPTQIQNNTATVSGGGIYTKKGIVRAVGKVVNHENQKIEISNNKAQSGSGGGVFCLGGSLDTIYVKLDNVKLVGNEVLGSNANQGTNVVSGSGGGIYLQKGKIEIIKCELQQNKAYVNGGGINNHEGNIEVSGCLIGGDSGMGNEAGTAGSSERGDGGGIYINTGNITVTDCQRGAKTYESHISYNKAFYNGGGLYTHEGIVTVIGGHEAQKRIEITHNEATTGNGGGIFCRGTDLNTEYITLTHVDVTDNNAYRMNSGVAQGENGGGIYLEKGIISITDVKLQNNKANLNGGGIYNEAGDIFVKGCLIGGDTDALGNKALRSGGGIYTNAGDIDIEDYIDNSVYGSLLHCETKIAHNSAGNNGGGIDTHSGTIWVNRNQRRDHQIEITHNTAKKGGGVYANQGKIYTYNAIIDNNTATENGGGLNNHSGDICIYGGSLSNNTAQTGHGGGAYTNVGDIDIWPFNPDNLGMLALTFNDGTKIFNNIALYNGGGVNNHTGRVDLRYATIQNNTATRGNGGGIFCEGPRTQAVGFTIRLMASLLNQNKTRGADGTDEEPTGRGGGIYLKYGRIFAQGTDLTYNTANINGGAINNHEGNIRVYGCNLQGNKATEGDGGGIFAHKGNIFIGSCGMKGSSSITLNTANQNGGGIYNYEGDISINGDQILQNTATEGDGGGIYVKLGDINMIGGQINDNTANNGNGGGIFMGGTVKGTGGLPDGNGFTISERIEHTPIVQIIDVELGKDATNENKYTATIHYHVVDDGNQGQGGTNTADGITWSDGSAISDVTDEPDGDVPGCRRKTISNLNGGQTYSVKAFATYTVDASTILRSESAVDFTTYSSNPVVIIGAATNIKKTEAEVNAKVQFDGFEEGTERVTYRGICYSTGDDPAAATKVLDPRDNNAAPYYNHAFYTVQLTGLTAGTTYNAWAYATNAATETGFVYSAAHTTFTTTANIPVVTTTSATAGNYNTGTEKSSATFVGTASQGDGSAITEYGFVWSIDDDPTIAHDPKHEFTGSPSGSFTFTIDTLDPGTNYHARAYAINNEGVSYGNAIEFITKDATNKPVVRSTRISDITQHAATVTNLLVYKGGSDVNKYGICWNTTGSPTIADSHSSLEGLEPIANDNTPFDRNMSELTANTTYHVRAFASNDDGATYSYGNDYTFTTLSSNPPRVEVDVTTTATQANIQCKVFYNGNNVNQFYIEWGKGTIDSTQVILSEIPEGDFTHTFTITPDEKDTEYWVYAYAKNEIGDFTNRKVIFRSGYAKPTVTPPVIGNITFNPATGHQLAQVTTTVTKGDNNVKAYGIVFGSTQYPSLERASEEDDSDIRYTRIEGDFSDQTINVNHILGSRWEDGAVHTSPDDPEQDPNNPYKYNALYSNRLYYVRAYATSKTGDLTDDDYTYAPEEDVLGQIYNPVMLLTLPNIYERGTNMVTNSSAILNAEITSKDPRHYLRKRGFVWSKTDTEPTYDPAATSGQYVYLITTGIPTAQTYNHTISELDANTTYYWRAFATNYKGDTAYSQTQQFKTYQYAVTAKAKPIAAATVTGGGYYDNGTSITLTATATNTNYAFINWKKDGSDYSNTSTITYSVDGNISFEAYYKVCINAVAGEHGSVTVSPGENNDHYFSYGQTCTMTATPASSYQFIAWMKDGVEVSNEVTYSITVNDEAGDMGGTYTAVFEVDGGRGAVGTAPQGNRPRDIYPAPAREPWDWDDDFFFPTDTMRNGSRTAPVNIPQINNNSAKYGGGVYVDKNESNPAKIVFAGGSTAETTGTINQNYASEAGGGVYINESASMQMKGHCHVNSNHVPEGKKGGGIYLDGVLKVGENPDDLVDAHALQVNENWAGNDGYVYDPTNPNLNNRNNVYLPNDPDPLPTADENLDAGNKQRVITLLSDISGTYTTGEEPNLVTNYYSKIGLSVDHGYRAVIYTSLTEPNHELWLTRLITDGSLSGAIFDDANLYYALHIHNENNPDDLKPQYDYLYGCWTTVVRANPTGNPEFGEGPHFTSNSYDEENATENETWHIYTKYGLAWFTSYVNGLNGCVAHPDVKAVLEADVDMSEHLWVPIGSVDEAAGTGTGIVFNDGGFFRGEFNGQGYLINGLKCYFVTGIKKYGLFGTVTSLETSDVTHIGKVKNTFVDNLRFYAFKMGEEAQYQYAYRMGGIASELEGSAVISACEARGVMNTPAIECDVANTYKGGLVGKMSDQAIIHSSMAMPEMSGTAKYVGGLVGELGTSNKLLNSFSNLKFPDAGYNDTIKIGGTPTNFYFGGLVGENNGLVENCYSRLQGTEPISNVTTSPNYNKSIFGWLAGTNKSDASILYCYAPRVANETGDSYPTSFYVKNTVGGSTLTGYDNYGATQRYSGKYGFKQRDHQMKLLPGTSNTYEQAAATGKASANDTLIGGLQFTLNRWVTEKNAITETTSPYYNIGFADWTRTMASPINDDYPIPLLTDFNAVGSEDSIYMHYKHNVDALIDAYTKLPQAKHPTPSIYLYDTIRNGITLLPITKSNNIGGQHPNVMLAINEDLGIIVSGDAASHGLKGRVGVTIKNSRKGDSDYTPDPNWHLFSSAIQSAPIGLQYHTSDTGNEDYVNNIVNKGPQKWSHPETVWAVRTKFDPPKTTWFKGNVNIDSVGYFPTNTPYGTWRDKSNHDATNLNGNGVGGFFDLYEYSEYYYHWLNYKREGTNMIQDHWHMDRNAGKGENDTVHEHYRIGWDKSDDDRYFNDVTMPAGKGYMMALSSESMMMTDGTLNMGDNITINVTNTDINLNLPPNGHGGGYNYTWIWRSLNMIGNPYQSYLDFKAFAVDNTNNSGVLRSDGGQYTYYMRDDNAKKYVSYTTYASDNSEYGSRFIHPHQGFFVMVNQSAPLQFTESMRMAGTSTSLKSEFREEHVNYPLVNLFCYDADGERDLTTVEINRPTLGGGCKAQNLRNSKALVYAHLEDTDYQIVFTPVGINTVPVRFEAEEDGVFTMKWNTLHGDFSYLHLIDNIAGVDVNCLTANEYRFEGKTTDYHSRFKLVFECTGLEENEDTTSPEHFAFQFGDELVVNGEGLLQMFDVQGRCLLSTQAEGQQSSISLPKVAAGVYLLRLTGSNQVKVQKMVIK